jgi:hypothetical protein
MVYSKLCVAGHCHIVKNLEQVHNWAPALVAKAGNARAVQPVRKLPRK